MADDDIRPAPAGPAPTIQTLLDQRRHREVIALAERAVAAAPGNPETWNLLGVGLRLDGRPWAAAAAHRRALDLAPQNATALVNLGNCAGELDHPGEAVAWYRQLVALAPSAIAWTHLGVALHRAGDAQAALPAFEAALALDPGYARAGLERAQALLRLGRFDAGWAAYESRWRLAASDRPRLPAFGTPRWDGGPLDGPLLVWPEQGFGDTILCARFLASLRGRVPRIVLACRPELRRLFQDLEGVDALVPADAPPPHAAHAPMMSLPLLAMRGAAAPPPPARLTVPAAARARLAALVAPHRGRLNVGIVWSGSVTFKANARRAATLDRFLAAACIPGVRLFSLQKGPPAAALDAPGLRSLVVDLGDHCADFADTAAAIEQLDLVLMTDSSVAHLAGSLGRPIWNLLPFDPYWLYGTGGAHTPWYASMRMFRQSRPGDWDGVFAAAMQALAEAAAAR
jgi:tetratricopeptide (TPR) repeat protein